MNIRLLLFLLAAAALSSCALLPDTITANPAGGIPITNRTLVTDLQSAAFNLDNAVAIGALDPDDPAPVCVHDVLRKAGIEVAPGAPMPKSFEPKKDGVASAGAIAYIIAQQAKKAKPLEVSPSCEALVGRIVIDGAKALNKAAPSIPSLVLR